MAKLSIIQRILIVQRYFESNCSVVRTERAFRRGFRNIYHPPPRCIAAKFKALCIVTDRQHPGRSRRVRSIDNIESVRQGITHNPQKSLRRHSEEHQISKTSLWLILRDDLNCYPYKIQLIQKNGQNDNEKRLLFAWLIIEIVQHEEQNCYLLITDEAHFHCNGFVNKHNSDIGEYKIQEL